MSVLPLASTGRNIFITESVTVAGQGDWDLFLIRCKYMPLCYHVYIPGASLSYLFGGYQEIFPWW